jgi:hypothetical protein
MTTEQTTATADDAALLADAMAVEAEFGAPAGVPGEAPAPVDPAAEIRALLEVLRMIASPLSPVVARVWTDDVLGATAPALAAVMDKYGLSLGGLDRWGPEIALAVAILPPTVATVQGIQAEAAERRRAEAERLRAARTVPSTFPPIASDGPQG